MLLKALAKVWLSTRRALRRLPAVTIECFNCFGSSFRTGISDPAGSSYHPGEIWLDPITREAFDPNPGNNHD